MRAHYEYNLFKLLQLKKMFPDVQVDEYIDWNAWKMLES